MKMLKEKVYIFFNVIIMLAAYNTILANSSPKDTAYEVSKVTVTSDLETLVDAEGKSLAAERIKCSSRPNILLIGIETLRADHVSCLGYHRQTIPTLDNLAKEGVLFSNVIATSSSTMPAVMSVFTSLYPGVHKTTDYYKKLPEGITTLAQILKDNAYVTAGFIANTTLDSKHGFSKGFNLYDDFSVSLDFSLDLFENNDSDGRRVPYTEETSEAAHRAAIGWLRDNHEKSFFMFVFYVDPHYDYTPPPPFDTVFDPNYDGSVDGRGMVALPRSKRTRPAQKDLEHIIALYDGEILYTDGYISELLGKFKEYGILNNTLIIVFGDHGEEFYEHGSNTHNHSLYRELIHVPLILRWPCVIPTDKQISALVSQVDIMPTILDYLDIEYDGFTQGFSIRELIEGKKEKVRDIVYSEVSTESNRFFSASISKEFKFILNLDTGEKQFFNLNNDLDEQVNIYVEKSAEGPIALEENLTMWLSNNSKHSIQLSGKEDVQTVEPDEDYIRRLKSLGYIQ